MKKDFLLIGNIMFKSLLLFISFGFCSSLLWGQVNLQRKVIATTGSYAGNDSAKLSISYTVGETIARTAIGNTGKFIVTMGFQQPDDILVSLGERLEATLQYSIYPNPTPEEVFVILSADQAVELILAITDLNGRSTPVPDQAHWISGTVNTRFNLGVLSDGYYLLSFKNKEGEIFKSVKIKKVH